MKVFIGWSGDTSHKVALALAAWIPKVIQAVKPFVSSEDIAKGARWSIEIAKELESSNYGIICITRDNLASLWVNFEAGALSREMGNSFVTPFLFDLKSSEVQGPLAQFQATSNDKDEIQKMLTAINDRLGDQRLEKGALEDAFEMRWASLRDQLAKVGRDEKGKPTLPKRTTEEMVAEILELVRALQRGMSIPISESELRRGLSVLPSDSALAYMRSVMGEGDSALKREIERQADLLARVAAPLGDPAHPSSNALRDWTTPATKPAVNPTFPRNRQKL